MDELAQVLKEAARLANEAAEAMRRGEEEKAVRLHQAADTAWWRARRLSQRHARRPTIMKGPSSRERSVAALADLGVPCSPKQIAMYSDAKTGERFDVRALASVRRDEYRSWTSGSKRDTYLVPALEGPWFVAGRGRFALSHWPLWLRIVGPLSPRADHLKSCLHLVDQIQRAPRNTEARSRMRDLLAAYARTVPGALLDAWHAGNDLNIDRVQAAVEAELALIKDEDENFRKHESERASRHLNDEQLIWGGSMPQVIARKLG